MDELTTREDLEEALLHHSKAAQAAPAAVGNSTWVSPWDRLHGRINELLDQLEVVA